MRCCPAVGQIIIDKFGWFTKTQRINYKILSWFSASPRAFSLHLCMELQRWGAEEVVMCNMHLTTEK